MSTPEFDHATALPTLVTEQIQKGASHATVLGQIAETLPLETQQQLGRRWEADLHQEFIKLSLDEQAKCLEKMNQPKRIIQIQVRNGPLPQKHIWPQSSIRAMRMVQSDSCVQEFAFTSEKQAGEKLFQFLTSVKEQECAVWNKHKQELKAKEEFVLETFLSVRNQYVYHVPSLKECMDIVKTQQSFNIPVYDPECVYVGWPYNKTRKVLIRHIPFDCTSECVHIYGQ